MALLAITSFSSFLRFVGRGRQYIDFFEFYSVARCRRNSDFEMPIILLIRKRHRNRKHAAVILSLSLHNFALVVQGLTLRPYHIPCHRRW